MVYTMEPLCFNKAMYQSEPQYNWQVFNKTIRQKKKPTI
ncbi:hypothetical protein JCM19274_3213 [Algibacter lectus]|uniref:Uncharacterized protein n=1 Tax=Algibacter lectus TaxID=221126 RepID=A0A090WS03_9FLAO|nr:hypothetical protein JCM19274_3213 [Algibacter lectus]